MTNSLASFVMMTHTEAHELPEVERARFPFVFKGIEDRGHFFCAVLEAGSHASFAKVYINTSVGQLKIEFLETAKDSRNAGHAKELLVSLFDYAAANLVGNRPAVIWADSYTSDGRAYLIPYLEKIQEAYPNVEFDSVPSC